MRSRHPRSEVEVGDERVCVDLGDQLLGRLGRRRAEHGEALRAQTISDERDREGVVIGDHNPQQPGGGLRLGSHGVPAAVATRVRNTEASTGLAR